MQAVLASEFLLEDIQSRHTAQRRSAVLSCTLYLDTSSSTPRYEGSVWLTCTAVDPLESNGALEAEVHAHGERQVFLFEFGATYTKDSIATERGDPSYQQTRDSPGKL